MTVHLFTTTALLLAVLAVTSLLVAGTVISLLAWAILHPPRMTDGKAAWVLKRVSPDDLGMRYEEVQFLVRDPRRAESLKIRGWWIPFPNAESARTVVMIHGYADAKIGSIAWAPTWQSLGFNILAIDLRAHGESGGTLCTGGYFERDDVRQVIHQLRARHPRETAGGIVLFGASLGTVVAAAVAGEGRPYDVERPHVLAVVLESPINSFPEGVRQHIRRLGIAGDWTAHAALILAERWSGADFHAFRLPDLLRTIPAPVLLIEGDADPFLPPSVRKSLSAAIQDRQNPRDATWTVPAAGHLMGLAADAEGYRRAIANVVDGPF